jgi:hypothetical protein
VCVVLDCERPFIRFARWTPSHAARSRGKDDVISTHSEELAREPTEKPDLGHPKDRAEDLLKAGQAPTLVTASRTPAKTLIRWLRWAAVLVLIYSAWTGLLYDVVPYDIGVHACPLFLFVAAGAKIAPRYRLATALVLAAVLVAHSCWGHLLSNQPPGVTNYQTMIAALQQIALQGMPAGGSVRHFILETLGAVLGVVYIFWSEKAKGSVASVPPDRHHLDETL